MAKGTTKIYSLKLFVDKKSHKVLFAEAPKEFVDFLLRLFSIPIGLVMCIVGKDVVKGSCLSSVHDSVEVLCSTQCLLPNFQNVKDLILWPHWSLDEGVSGDGGYVKGTVTYMVLDDLTVKPMNTLSLIVDIVNNLKIKDVGSIEELVVDVSSVEVPKILDAAMKSKTVLTDVFLNNNKEEEEEEEGEGEEDPIPRELD